MSCLLLLLGALSPATELPETVLFDGHRLEGARWEGPPWTRTPRGLEGGGTGSALVSEQELGPGDVAVRVRLALAERSGTGAALRLGTSVLGLDGDGGALFVDGPLFGDRRARLDDGARWFQPGRAFDLEVRREAGTLSVLLDGKSAYASAVGAEALGRVALVPGRNTLTLERLVLAGALVVPAPLARDARLQGQVEEAVTRGVDWLLERQLRDGSWRHMQYGFRGGQTALCAYTLLRAGLPPDHPAVARAFLFLDGVEPAETYTAGLACMAYEALRDPARLPRLAGLAQEIAGWGPRGQWGYPRAHEGDFARWLRGVSAPDLSNTQYAVLGLRAARHAGVDVPDKLWSEVVDHTLALQEDAAPGAPATRRADAPPPAGFRYAPEREPSLSMTAAGVAVLEIARETLGPKLRGERLQTVERAIAAGTAWLAERFTPDDHPGGSRVWHYYALYGVERVGTLLDLETLGGADWYGEGARWLLRQQSDDGHWGLDKPFAIASHHAEQDETDTCFAILFLKRASRPTVATEAPAWSAREDADPTESIRFRARGDTTAVLWIDGFSDAFRAERGGAGGLRVARVEYLDGADVIASVAGDPARAWDGQGFAVRHEFATPGRHAVLARVHVVAPDAPAGAAAPLVAYESRAVELRSAGRLEPWMRDAAEARGRNLLLAAAPRLSASSTFGKEDAADAVDGREDSRWSSSAGDAAPWLLLELPKPVKADTLVLGQGGGARDLAGRYDRILAVSVRVNREKDALELELGPDELAPSVLPLGRLASIGRLEIRVTRRAEGGDWKGRVALSEVALERRGDGR